MVWWRFILVRLHSKCIVTAGKNMLPVCIWHDTCSSLCDTIPSALNMMQVWTIYSGITGYMLYMCGATKRMASSTPRMVFPEQGNHIVVNSACEAHNMSCHLHSSPLQLQCLACRSACSNCGTGSCSEPTYSSIALATVEHSYCSIYTEQQADPDCCVVVCFAVNLCVMLSSPYASWS